MFVAWGPLGERVAQYLSKGRPCLVGGRLQSRSWEQEGQKRSKVEVVASDVTFLGGGLAGQLPSAPAAKPAASKQKDDVVIGMRVKSHKSRRHPVLTEFVSAHSGPEPASKLSPAFLYGSSFVLGSDSDCTAGKNC